MVLAAGEVTVKIMPIGVHPVVLLASKTCALEIPAHIRIATMNTAIRN